jgi:hypothetical protein
LLFLVLERRPDSSTTLCCLLLLQLLSASADEDQLCTKPNPLAVECELHPPKSDSYVNLYDDGQDVPLGGSAHSLRNLLSSTSSTGGRESPKRMIAEQRPLAPDALYSPVGHAVTGGLAHHAADGAARNNSEDCRNNCSRKLNANPASAAVASVPSVLANDAKYPTVQALAPVVNLPSSAIGRTAGGRTSPTALKSSAGARTVSPTNVDDADCELTVGQVALTTADSAVGPGRRPMSFVKALELSDKLAATDDRQRRRGGAGNGGGGSSAAAGLLHQQAVPEASEEDCGDLSTTSGDIERRQFGSSYEIAV